MSTSIIPESNSESLSKIIKSPETILQQVDNRHWQLFETRLKNPFADRHTENSRIIDQSEVSIQLNQRWQTFCSQLTNKSNETDRLMSIFQNISMKNWNTTQKQHQTKSILNQNTFLKHLPSNEHDKKVISSILHQNFN
jgi:hypothetical protein